MPLACLSCRCRLPALLLPLIAVAAPAWANEAPRRNTLPGLALAPVAAGASDPLLGAAEAELLRIAAELSDETEPPYWIQVGILDRRVVDVQATHGAAVAA